MKLYLVFYRTIGTNVWFVHHMPAVDRPNAEVTVQRRYKDARTETRIIRVTL